MKNKLTFKPNDFYEFLLLKLIDLETDLILQKRVNNALFLHINPDKTNTLELVNDEILKHRSTIKEAVLELYQAQLAGLSVDIDKYLAKILNQS